jgi:chemotaxis response regulator CheB
MSTRLSRCTYSTGARSGRQSEVVRRGICQILQLESDIEVICEAADGADAVRKAREHWPDVVLLDIAMPVINGFETARRIKHESPSTLILMVSQFDSVGKGLELAVAWDSTKVDVSRLYERREAPLAKGSLHSMAIGAEVKAAGTTLRPSCLPGFTSRSRH